MFQVCMAFRILTNRNLSLSDLRSIVAGQTGNLIAKPSKA
jgi:hypothetical protein